MGGKSEYLDVDEVAEALGGFGRFQLLMYILGSLPAIFTAQQVVAPSYTAYQPDYRCRIPGCDVGDTPDYNPGDPWINVTIPYDDDDVLLQCETYHYEITEEAGGSTEVCKAKRIDDKKVECDEWVFDHSEFKSTIITDFELTCGNDFFKPLVSSLYMAGLLVGAPAWGWFSDKFGRKLCLVASTFSAGVVGIVLGLMPERISYTIVSFLNGVANIGIFQTAFLLGMEFVGLKYRMVLGTCVQYFFAFGEASVTFFAYFIRRWWILQIVLAAPMCLAISYYWLMSESIRWLLAQGRWQEARDVILRAARMNKVEVPEHLMPNERSTTNKEETVEEISILKAVKDLLILRILVVSCYLWFASAFSYYALSLNASNLGGSVYVNVVCSMLVEFPAYTLMLLLLDRIGRRWCTILSFLFAGTCCIIAGFMEDGSAAAIALSLLGKMFISCSFALAYTFTSEIFPTVIRTTCVGTCSLFSRAGSIISPFIASAGEKNTFVPFVVCGSVALLGALVSLDLPETNGSEYPETLEDTKNLKRKSGGIFSLKTRVG